MKKKIYDCITFFQSNLLFELRFHILKNIVDHFVICEATKTHMGNPKKILFNLKKWKKYGKKIIFISSSAIYSEKLKNNIKEKNFFYGKPHKAEYYYGLSKRIFYDQLVSLNLDHKINYSYIIMNNLYGPNDNFNIKNGHVIPSLIHKFYIAKKNNSYVIKFR